MCCIYGNKIAFCAARKTLRSHRSGHTNHAFQTSVEAIYLIYRAEEGTQDRTAGNLPPIDSRALYSVKPSYIAVSLIPPMSESSDLQSFLVFIQIDDYLSRMVTHKIGQWLILQLSIVVILTAVIYDYRKWCYTFYSFHSEDCNPTTAVLTFAREVRHFHSWNLICWLRVFKDTLCLGKEVTIIEWVLGPWQIAQRRPWTWVSTMFVLVCILGPLQCTHSLFVSIGPLCGSFLDYVGLRWYDA